MLHLRIAELRSSRGSTQADLAQHLQITQQTYSSYETGRRQMSYETLCTLADYFEVSTDYLLGRQNAIPSFLSEEERMIISQYRELGEYAKSAVRNSLSFEYAHALKSANIKKPAI